MGLFHKKREFNKFLEVILLYFVVAGTTAKKTLRIA
jgi:hypothetical protein